MIPKKLLHNTSFSVQLHHHILPVTSLGTNVSVISSDPPCKDGNAPLHVPLKSQSDEKYGRNCQFLTDKVLNSDNFAVASYTQ